MYGQEQTATIPYSTVSNLASSPLWLLVVVCCAIVSPAIHPHGLGFTFSTWVPPNMIRIVSANLLGMVLFMLFPLGCGKFKIKCFLPLYLIILWQTCSCRPLKYICCCLLYIVKSREGKYDKGEIEGKKKTAVAKNRTPNLSSQYTATELQQPDNNQPSQYAHIWVGLKVWFW